MSKFNIQATQTGRFSTNSINRAGGASHTITDSKKELASVILASMLKGNSYYEGDSDRIQRVFDLVANMQDKKFAAKAMIYVRQEGNLRSISHVLANAIVSNNDGSYSIKNAIKNAVVRPDDMTEMAALYFNRNPGKMLPNSMRRAFKELLESSKWGNYQYRKYAGNSSSVKLKDIIKLTHPKKNFKAVIEDTVRGARTSTLEVKLAGGQSAASAFGDMLRENRLGYMAAIKNIRNAVESGIDKETLDLWVKLVTNRDRILKSRMLPFRFVDAWQAILDANIDSFVSDKIKDAFDVALIISAENLGFVNSEERIAIVIDESGSMYGAPWKNAITLAAVLYHAFPKGNVLTYKFGDTCAELKFGSMSPLDIIFSTSHGGCLTLFEAPLDYLIKTKTIVDKIIMLTDMQLYQGCGEPTFDAYVNRYKKISPQLKLLFWDLNGYGVSTPVELRNNILLASGFSDKLMAIIPKLWKDQNALINEIESIEI